MKNKTMRSISKILRLLDTTKAKLTVKDFNEDFEKLDFAKHQLTVAYNSLLKIKQ